MEAIFSQISPQNRILETSIRHKNSEKGPTFLSKTPERVDIETIKWHTPCKNIMIPPGWSQAKQRHTSEKWVAKGVAKVVKVENMESG